MIPVIIAAIILNDEGYRLWLKGNLARAGGADDQTAAPRRLLEPDLPDRRFSCRYFDDLP
jgi:hypothetical protein